MTTLYCHLFPSRFCLNRFDQAKLSVYPTPTDKWTSKCAPNHLSVGQGSCICRLRLSSSSLYSRLSYSIRGSEVTDFHGERTTEAIAKFAIRANGPAVRALQTGRFPDSLGDEAVSFVYVGADSHPLHVYLSLKHSFIFFSRFWHDTRQMKKKKHVDINKAAYSVSPLWAEIVKVTWSLRQRQWCQKAQ